MKILLKQRQKFGEITYDLFDENNNVIYVVTRKIVSFGENYTIYDKNENNIAKIKQNLGFNKGCFDFFYDSKIDTISRKNQFLIPKYELKNKQWLIKQNCLGNKYFVYDENNKLIMDISIKMLTLIYNANINIYINDDNIFICIMTALSLIFILRIRSSDQNVLLG